MTAQRPPSGLGESPGGGSIPDAAMHRPKSWAGTRSFVFFPDEDPHTYDYLTQQRTGDEGAKNGVDADTGYSPPEGEMMLGTVVGQGNTVLTELGCADDCEWNKLTAEHLKHALDGYFDVGGVKGKEQVGKGDKVKGLWAGILGISADFKPWVGRIPDKVSGRPAPRTPLSRSGPCTRLAAPGEWIAAGYSGEGMVHAWMSGKALAYMVLGLDKDTVGRPEKESSMEGGEDLEAWFPHVYRFSEERWKSTGFEDLIATFLAD